MGLYVVAGMAGLPWFADHASGYAMSTFGYLIGFVVAGALLGYLAQRGGDRTVPTAMGAMAIGDLALFVIAVPWLAVSLHVSLAQAISWGFTPFIGGEIIKIAIAGVTLPYAWRFVDRTTKNA